jgi:hypothetical protein
MAPRQGDQFAAWWTVMRKRVPKGWHKAFDSLSVAIAGAI